jgi:clan AA aspartic protease (TIGR02281 family)
MPEIRFKIVGEFHFLLTFDFHCFVLMKIHLTFVIFLFCLKVTLAQDIVKMEKENGVYKIPCKVNGLSLRFIFDTGASDVSISLTEALFMLKNGYMTEADIKGTVYYSIANGEIAEGTKINLRKIEVGKQVLYNVEASIVHTSQAPLLFGQSAMERFGTFTMDYSNSNLIIGNSTSTSSNAAAVSKAVKIGNQTWMSENLNVAVFRNGDPILEARTIEEWQLACENKQPVWCFYNFDSNNESQYGRLYNWYVIVDPRNISPIGWKLPLAKDFERLFKYVDPKTSVHATDIFDSLAGVNTNFWSSTVAEKLKSNSGWEHTIVYPDKPCGDECNGNNSSGFNAKPSSFIGNIYDSKYKTSSMHFEKEGSCFIWAGNISVFDESGYGVKFDNKESYSKLDHTGRYEGLSIRCLKE